MSRLPNIGRDSLPLYVRTVETDGFTPLLKLGRKTLSLKPCLSITLCGTLVGIIGACCSEEKLILI